MSVLRIFQRIPKQSSSARGLDVYKPCKLYRNVYRLCMRSGSRGRWVVAECSEGLSWAAPLVRAPSTSEFILRRVALRSRCRMVYREVGQETAREYYITRDPFNLDQEGKGAARLGTTGARPVLARRWPRAGPVQHPRGPYLPRLLHWDSRGRAQSRLLVRVCPRGVSSRSLGRALRRRWRNTSFRAHREDIEKTRESETRTRRRVGEGKRDTRLERDRRERARIEITPSTTLGTVAVGHENPISSTDRRREQRSLVSWLPNSLPSVSAVQCNMHLKKKLFFVYFSILFFFFEVLWALRSVDVLRSWSSLKLGWVSNGRLIYYYRFSDYFVFRILFVCFFL